MTIPTFAAPPHPQSVLRYLKTARRAYQESGTAAGADIPTIAGQAASAALVVSGTVYVAAGCHMPATVSVSLNQSDLKGTQTANVNLATGAFTATIPGGLGSAGAATVRVVGPSYCVFTTDSNSFTLT